MALFTYLLTYLQMALKVWLEDIHWRCRSDVFWQTVPHTSSGDRKGSVDSQVRPTISAEDEEFDEQ